MNFRIVFIRRKSEQTTRLPAVVVGYVAGRDYVQKVCCFDPSVEDGLAEQLHLAGLEASREIECRNGLERGVIAKEAQWDQDKARAAIAEFLRG